ncbi:MAG: PEP-CTERM sorting domain-containing protein, partial [Deltaproteobacteria bacterium]|nr:PEP-CTERM sorting domain-containing protein [Candidatus Zymogenaceae bacterium]
QVASGAQLTVSSIVQGTLSIGGAPPSASMASQPVPEPGSLFSLLILVIVWGAGRRLRKKVPEIQ